MYFLSQLFYQSQLTLKAGSFWESIWGDNTQQENWEAKKSLTDNDINSAVDRKTLDAVSTTEASDPDNTMPGDDIFDSVYTSASSNQESVWDTDKHEKVKILEPHEIEKLSASELDELIQATELEIETIMSKPENEITEEVEARGEKLMDFEKSLKSRSVVLKGLKNESDFSGELKWTAALENSEKNLSLMRELQTFITPSMRTKFWNINKLMMPIDAIVSKETISSADEVMIWEMLQELLNFLKWEQNREVLVQVSREMKHDNPQKYENFKSFLIGQDSEFTTIFTELETEAYDGRDATLLAALPTDPIDGNVKNEFKEIYDDGTTVMLDTSSNEIIRSISYDGAGVSVPTDLLDVDLRDAQETRDGVLHEYWRKKQIGEYVIKMLEDNPNLDFSRMKEWLKKSLGTELYIELWIDSITDANQAKSHIESKIDSYSEVISDAKRTFKELADESIARMREVYERRDEEKKLTLKSIAYSGLGIIWIERIMSMCKANMVNPDLWVGFDPWNYDLSKNNLWETASRSDNPTGHLEIIYRMVNKCISGNPTEPFSIDPRVLEKGNPPAMANSRPALELVLLNAWIINGSWIVNYELVKARLNAKITQQTESNLDSNTDA